jgi:hypothetical protein
MKVRTSISPLRRTMKENKSIKCQVREIKKGKEGSIFIRQKVASSLPPFLSNKPVTAPGLLVKKGLKKMPPFAS